MSETNAERLEAIKFEWSEVKSTHQFRPLTLGINDVEWLIKQAERVQELENRFTQRVYIKGLKEENSRLSEALEFYADSHNYTEYENRKLGLIIDVVEDGGEKARQALKCESHENNG